MTHSKNGNSASITTGTSASVICQSPTTMRAVSAAATSLPITHGDGCFAELAPRIAQSESLAGSALGGDGHDLFLQIGDHGEHCRGGGFEKVRSPPSWRHRDRPPRSCRRVPGRPAGGRPRRPSPRREQAARARMWPAACCTSAGTRSNRRRRRRGPRTSARDVAARPGRSPTPGCRTASSSSAAKPGWRRTAASSAAFGPLCNRASRMLRTTDRSSSPRAEQQPGEQVEARRACGSHARWWRRPAAPRPARRPIPA